MTSPNRPPSCDIPPEHYGDLKPKACPVCGYCTPEVIAGRIDVQIECYCCKTRGPDRADYILATQSWNSIPRRSEVAELLRLVDETIIAPPTPAEERLLQYAAKLRKGWNL